MKKYRSFQDLQISNIIISLEFQQNYHIIYDFWEVDDIIKEEFGVRYHLKGLGETKNIFIPKPDLESSSFSYRPVIWFASVGYGLKAAKNRLNVVRQDFYKLYNDIKERVHQENLEFQKILHDAHQCIKTPKENEN